MAVLRTIVGLAATAMLIQLTMAANYTVGGSDGSWDSCTDLQTWVASQNFAVGDNLSKSYANINMLYITVLSSFMISILASIIAQKNVTKADCDSCQTSSPIQTCNDGNIVIPLSSPGKYIICGTLGHCSQGMQIEIDTLATSTPPATSPTPPSASPAPKSSPSPAKSPQSAPGSPSSPDGSATESTGTSPSPSGLSPPPPPPPSSADRNSFQTCLTLGFGLLLLVLLALEVSEGSFLCKNLK